jgi:predicted phosphodiesterase
MSYIFHSHSGDLGRGSSHRIAYLEDGSETGDVEHLLDRTLNIGRSEQQFQAVVGANDFQRRADTDDFLKMLCFTLNLHQFVVIEGRLVVEQADPFRLGRLAEFDPDHIARMPPVLTD